MNRDELEKLIIDLTDGSLRDWWEIERITGCSEEKSKEMEKLIDLVYESHSKKKLIR